jgi:hypothetical protein
MYPVAYRILVASLVVCLLLIVGMLLLERTGFIEIDEKAIQPEVVSCQIGHKDMQVRVLGQGQRTAGRLSPGTSSGSLRLAGAPCTTGTGPTGIRKDFHTAVTLRITGYAEPTSGLEPLSCSLRVRCSIAKDAGCVSLSFSDRVALGSDAAQLEVWNRPALLPGSPSTVDSKPQKRLNKRNHIDKPIYIPGVLSRTPEVNGSHP